MTHGLPGRTIKMLATGDVFWDTIIEIASAGEHDVYDGTVSGTHNFVANSIVAHNSLEQDSDVVILVYRPEAFERDSLRAGEADLIVAKQRNGPAPKTCTVTARLAVSQFNDLAWSSSIDDERRFR